MHVNLTVCGAMHGGDIILKRERYTTLPLGVITCAITTMEHSSAVTVPLYVHVAMYVEYT